MSDCSICGEPMPPGEEMFKFHGYSGSCPKPPLPSFVSVMAIALDDAAYLRDLAAYIDPVYKRRLTEIAAKLDHAKADSASEIADLKHQVSEQALKYLSAMGQWDELEADLRQRLEVAEKDATRYRWLRDVSTGVDSTVPMVHLTDRRGRVKTDDEGFAPFLDGGRLDAAIDAAMKEQK